MQMCLKIFGHNGPVCTKLAGFICFFSVSQGDVVLSIKCKSRDKSFPSAHSEGMWESGSMAPHILSLTLDGGERSS